MLDQLKTRAEKLGKPAWRDMLIYAAELHARATHPARPPFPFAWEEIGPGYCYGPAFGHWDIVHQVLDVLPDEPQHAREQIINNLACQQADGMVPGSIYLQHDNLEEVRYSTDVTVPPLWPVAAEAVFRVTQDEEFLKKCGASLERQIEWFETQRAAHPRGFYYKDVLTREWESGVDQGIRYDDAPQAKAPCIDATAHLHWCYVYAGTWRRRMGRVADDLQRKAFSLRKFIRMELFDRDMGWFADGWLVNRPTRRWAFEGMWPVVTGAATREQAEKVIENLLNPQRFGTPHPIASVAPTDPLYEGRMWRGPAWNSMTLWAASGCVRYGRRDAARLLLEHALEQSATRFAIDKTIWEFYDAEGGDPAALERKPETQCNQPCRDYLGHNPLLAMARLWARCG